MGRYVMEGKQYFLSPGRNFAFFVAPYQATLEGYSRLVRRHNLHQELCLSLSFKKGTFNDLTLNLNAVYRVLCSKQDGEAYATAISEFSAT